MSENNLIMEHQKILNLLNEATNCKFVARKWNINNSKSGYAATNEITFNTAILRSNLGNFNIAYLLVRGDFTVIISPQTQVAFKNCAPFTSWIIQIDETIIDDAESLDMVMPMYNLVECSSNYSETTGSL